MFRMMKLKRIFVVKLDDSNVKVPGDFGLSQFSSYAAISH